MSYNPSSTPTFLKFPYTIELADQSPDLFDQRKKHRNSFASAKKSKLETYTNTYDLRIASAITLITFALTLATLRRRIAENRGPFPIDDWSESSTESEQTDYPHSTTTNSFLSTPEQTTETSSSELTDHTPRSPYSECCENPYDLPSEEEDFLEERLEQEDQEAFQEELTNVTEEAEAAERAFFEGQFEDQFRDEYYEH